MPVNLLTGVNSYISIEDADAYFNMRLYSEVWMSSSQDEKAQALIMATSRIERLKIKGRKTNPAQALQFPRTIFSPNMANLFTYNYTPYCGYIVEQDVSQNVKNAVCEEALSLLKGIPKRLELQNQGVQTFTIGNLSETYNGKKLKLLSQDALDLLSSYLVGSVKIT